MNSRRLGAIIRKELMDMLRDRRTMIAMVGVPIVLYPVLFIFGSQAAMVQQDKLRRTASVVAVYPGTDPSLASWLENDPLLHVVETTKAAENFYSGDVDAVISTSQNVDLTLLGGGSLDVEVHYDAAEPDSRQALRRVSDALYKHGESILDERLTARGIDREFIRPVDVHGTNDAPAGKTTGALLGTILPMIMVIMLGVGAFYPAIDLTAGEKERGTFETLLSTPTSTTEIVCGKFFTVFCLSLLAGFLNLGSLLITFGFQLAQMDQKELQISLPIETVALIALVIVPLAFFISALMMTVAMFAKTFKEAQNFVTPFFILIMFPAVFAAIPGTELTVPLYFVPIANVALLFKELMTQQGSAEEVLVVFLSTAAYAALALLGAVWIFKREEVILAEEHGLPITLRRSVFLPRSVPTPGMIALLYVLALLLNFYVGTYFAREPFSGLLITEWALILAPTLLLLWYTRVNLVEGLNLRTPGALAFLGTLIVAASWAVIVIQLGYWQNKLLPIPKEIAEQMNRLFEGRSEGSGFALLMFAVALSPAICEEILFRGAILSGVRGRMPAWAAILLVGLLFGLLHVSVHRLVVTTLSGIVLTYLVYRTRSIFASMTAHFILNATAILAATRFAAILDRYQIEQRGEPMWAFVSALAVFVLGLALVGRGSKSKEAHVLTESVQTN